MDYQRTRARTFTGVTDDEWTDFEKNVKYLMGGGKRSMIIATFIRKYNQLSMQSYEQQATMEQKVHHAMNDSLKFYNIPVFKREVENV